MTWIEVISVAAGLLAFFQAGHFVGRRGARNKRKAREDELFASRLDYVFGSVRITKLECEPHSVAHGQTISMVFTIVSEARLPYQVWLGASAIDAHGQEHCDARQDTTVTLEKGEQSRRRELIIPIGVSTGNCRLIGAVWLGQRSHPERSIRLDSRECSDILRIR